MNISIVGRHVKVNDELKEHINATIDVFKKYNLDIISVNAIISQEEKHGKNVITFEYVINMAHQDTIVVKQKDKDLHNAIDIATDRVSKILRRHSDKIKSHKAQKLSDVVIEEEEDLVAKQLEQFENEIVPVKLASYKPIEIEEALNELKSGDESFKVFYDMDDNLRVLYKMKDGKQFGLI
ncbi:MAG TPA: ribosome-associated translation inhibitor RaiA [Arcobacter sp.]|jgi:putative sigma-54 modulation protein|nr:ribosome-associated translation inhibitor RaiA [Arcobacter sp.]